MSYKCVPCGESYSSQDRLEKHDCKQNQLATLRFQLATALAERDAARERVGELKYANEGQVLVVQSWKERAESVEQERDQLKRERDEAAAIESMVCSTCHGVGELTVFSGQTPDSYQEETVECSCITNIKDEAYRQGFEDCREAAALAADKHAEECMVYDELDGIEKPLVGDIVRVLPVPERGKKA